MDMNSLGASTSPMTSAQRHMQTGDRDAAFSHMRDAIDTAKRDGDPSLLRSTWKSIAQVVCQKTNMPMTTCGKGGGKGSPRPK